MFVAMADTVDYKGFLNDVDHFTDTKNCLFIENVCNLRTIKNRLFIGNVNILHTIINLPIGNVNI